MVLGSSFTPRFVSRAFCKLLTDALLSDQVDRWARVYVYIAPVRYPGAADQGSTDLILWTCIKSGPDYKIHTLVLRHAPLPGTDDNEYKELVLVGYLLFLFHFSIPCPLFLIVASTATIAITITSSTTTATQQHRPSLIKGPCCPVLVLRHFSATIPIKA
ncbi:hypothetical protein BC939DRAFT_474788 [Gamsiella multidivaricata]|uniref:uncharacterized protein n=1 Tax=Gamsiella multidivaricata TaxID=101098 RepID=UPI0022203232|nr:uncharacterized protein BC939DRAFT_474788 [Gamsiella multidivaricata]KAI7828615.1 hypothetical protein BC939DRAFT_474788 [Gamsiella multidivaricata]